MISRLRGDTALLGDYDPTVLDTFKLRHGKLFLEIFDVGGSKGNEKEITAVRTI